MMISKKNEHWYQALMLWLAILGLVAAFSSLAREPAVTAFCESELVSEEGPDGYQERGDRCEGIYRRRVSGGGTGLKLVSFTSLPMGLGLNPGETVRLEWQAPHGGEVELVAEGLSAQVYYRMNTRQPVQQRFFEWRTSIPARYSLGLSDIGILVRLAQPFPGSQHRLYLPVLLNPSPRVAAARSYRVRLLPDKQLTEIYWSLARFEGGTTESLEYEKPLAQPPYPPRVVVDLDLPVISRAGVYCLGIGAEVAEGGSDSLDICFYDGH